ncbi:Hsp70 ATPase ssa1 [Fusarium falciforme]|nr:Hsp70 ATPase ssa1 [Fusarium falciforme]
MVAEAEKFKAEDEQEAQRVQAKNQLESYAFTLKNSVSENNFKERDASQAASTEEYQGKAQKELEGVANPITE